LDYDGGFLGEVSGVDLFELEGKELERETKGKGRMKERRQE
jgi:hypothetical protein